ncbi:hypothetical protein RvY_05948 [Ramazzottius varieornatus]|uniref:DUF7788 domain-containing protein n=1 Tax=Ramazzottius varieornatus TaxID=947166 RepID=A0A1D1UWT7_RAMVA|nr:hypothetical protein RvY_05948 [Ramazzottius varieornatus]
MRSSSRVCPPRRTVCTDKPSREPGRRPSRHGERSRTNSSSPIWTPYVETGKGSYGMYGRSGYGACSDSVEEFTEVDATVEGQWKTMVAELAKTGSFKNCQAVCDVSASMSGEPTEVAVALGLVVSELTEEPFRNQLITFSHTPKLHTIKGTTHRDRVCDVMEMEWGMNTDLLKVFDLLLEKTAENYAQST